MEFVKEGLNGKLIARVCHCSPSSVRRTIKERNRIIEWLSCRTTCALMNFVRLNPQCLSFVVTVKPIS